MAHVCPFGAGDVTSAVAAGVSQVAARTLRKTRKLVVKMMRKREDEGQLFYDNIHDKGEES